MLLEQQEVPVVSETQFKEAEDIDATLKLLKMLCGLWVLI